jgi:hypothetical protein
VFSTVGGVSGSTSTGAPVLVLSVCIIILIVLELSAEPLNKVVPTILEENVCAAHAPFDPSMRSGRRFWRSESWLADNDSIIGVIERGRNLGGNCVADTFAVRTLPSFIGM